MSSKQEEVDYAWPRVGTLKVGDDFVLTNSEGSWVYTSGDTLLVRSSTVASCLRTVFVGCLAGVLAAAPTLRCCFCLLLDIRQHFVSDVPVVPKHIRAKTSKAVTDAAGASSDHEEMRRRSAMRAMRRL